MKTQNPAVCPVCDGTRSESFARFAEFEWLLCACGAIYKRDLAVDPEPAGADSFEPDGHYGKRYSARHDHRVAKARRQIQNALNHTTPGPLLDIGCSFGYTLEAGHELGLEAVGADISPVAVRHCRSLGFEAEQATLESLPFAAGRFHVVTMKHVLEHTATPRVALAETHRVMAPGGALFIAVPHAGYWKAVRDPHSSRFYRPDSHSGIEHQVYYRPALLAKMVSAAGYRVAAIHPQLLHRRAGTMTRVAQSLLAAPRFVGGALRTQLGLRKEFWLVAVRD